MKYYLLSNSIVISVGDKTHVISNDDYRYNKIKENLVNKNYETVQRIINPTNNLNKEGFVVNEGLVYFKNEPIPSVLGNRFLELSQDSWEFKSIFNFWFNIKTRVTNVEAAEVIEELVKKDAYAVTEDGFYFVYQNADTDQSRSVLNKKNHQEIFHFYNYSTCPEVYQNIFKDKKNLDDLIELTFGFNSKKLKKFVLKNIFQGKDNFLNYRFLFIGEALKDVLAQDNLFAVIEKDLIPTNLGDIGTYQNLNRFFKDYSLDENGNYSQKKILNLLENTANKQLLMDVGIYYCQLKDAINFDIRNMGFANNCQQMYDYMTEEMKKIKNPILPLNNDPEVVALHDEEVGDFRIAIPQTNHELVEWGNILVNCVGTHGYADSVRNKTCRIVGIMDKNTNQMLYHIEIKRKTIVQFFGRGNSQADKNHQKVIREFLKEKGMIIKE